MFLGGHLGKAVKETYGEIFGSCRSLYHRDLARHLVVPEVVSKRASDIYANSKRSHFTVRF